MHGGVWPSVASRGTLHALNHGLQGNMQNLGMPFPSRVTHGRDSTLTPHVRKASKKLLYCDASHSSSLNLCVWTCPDLGPEWPEVAKISGITSRRKHEHDMAATPRLRWWSAVQQPSEPAPGLTTWSKKLLGPPGIAIRSKDATRGSWPYYFEQEATRASWHRY